jgi:hypothetical protein
MTKQIIQSSKLIEIKLSQREIFVPPVTPTLNYLPGLRRPS